jgi:hypothetical protein
MPCEVGKYCPNFGMSSGLVCPAGFKCNTTGLSTLTSNCIAGAYSVSANGSLSCQFCPIGNYCPRAGLTTPSLCDGGYFCNSSGLTAVSGGCMAGYYCPAGSNSSKQNMCPSGSYCPALSDESILCPAGSICPSNALSTYQPCPLRPGFGCPIGSSSPSSCDAGTYSNNLTLLSTGLCQSCPIGTFNGLAQQSSCTLCAGSYCSTIGLTTPTGECTPGHFCPAGSTSMHLCEAGTFCSQSSMIEAQVCMVGSFCPSMGLTAALACTEGSYCDRIGLTSESGICPVGFYCAGNTSSAMQSACQPGQYCPSQGI